MKRSPLRQVSKKRRRDLKTRAEVRAVVLDRDQDCRARGLIPLHICAGPLDVHERIPRSAWADGYLDPDNCLTLCRSAHDFVHDHSDLAVELGLLGKSWDRTDPVWLERRDRGVA